MLAFTKIKNHGASNPIVARIAIGVGRLARKSQLSNEQKENIVVECDVMADRLIDAYQSGQAVIDEIDGIENRLHEKYKNDPEPKTPTAFESLINTTEILHFLKHAKAALRCAASILGITLGKQTNNKIWEKAYRKGRFDLILDDLKKETQSPDSILILIKIIETYAGWLEYISNRRDDDEHPKTFDKLIKNYGLLSNDGVCYLTRPSFQDGSNIYEFIKHSMKYLLNFCEELCIYAIEEKLPLTFFVQEIPEEQRDSQCPERFRISL